MRVTGGERGLDSEVVTSVVRSSRTFGLRVIQKIIHNIGPQ